LPDLLVIVPSRGRPQNVRRLLDAVHSTARLETHVHVAVDHDDPELSGYRAVIEDTAGEDTLEVGPRKGLCAWTNEVALRWASEYRFLASLGDDMVPRTPGWDRALCTAIEDMGGTGLAYPWDGTREDVPEAVVMSSDIVAALGWMCLPGLEHWYCDDTWAVLGRGAGCIRHLRAVAVDHVRGTTDATAIGNGKSLDADRETFWAWRRGQAADDIRTVTGLRERALQPA
jgi:hypothetical protein